jgi:lipid II:glycine glycyltransferase (peptidoglycan interpeptide bridge formation enzyme)
MAFDISEPELATVSLSESGSSGRITVRAVDDIAEWDALVAAAPQPHLPQDYAYSCGKAATGWPARRVVFLDAGRPVAFAVVLQLRRYGIGFLNRVNRGPIFLGAKPSDEQIVAVYKALRQHFGRLWTLPLLIAPALPNDERSNRLLRQAGYRYRAPSVWRSGRIDLTIDEDRLWASFSSTFRNRTRAAEKAGAELRIAEDAETYEWMIARHLENMAETDFSAASPIMLRALREAAPHNVTVFQLVHKGKALAGMSLVRFGRVAEYHIGWFGAEGRRFNAGNFLMWNVMRELKRRGVASFDVGGLKRGDGYSRFKRTMNPVEYELASEWMSF